jgi:hypothetical protein
MGMGLVFRIIRQQRDHVHRRWCYVVHLVYTSSVQHQATNNHVTVQQDSGKEGPSFGTYGGGEDRRPGSATSYAWR